MKQIFKKAAQCLLGVLFLVGGLKLQATTVTGAFANPGLQPANGVLYFTLVVPGGRIAIRQSVAELITPTTVTVQLNSSGQIPGSGVTLIGDDDLSPTDTYYQVQVKDQNGNLLGTQLIYITGATANLGTITYVSSVPTTPTFVLPVIPIANGGTGQTTATAAFAALAPATSTGGLIVGTGTDTYGNLALGSNGACLTSNGTTAVWGSCGSGNLPTISGATTNLALSNNGTSALWTILGVAGGGTGLSSLGSAGQCIQVNSGATALTYGTCGTGSAITFQTNGTNNSSQTVLNLVNSAATNGQTLSVTNVTGGSVQLGISGALTVAGGGTGQTTAANAFNALAPATSMGGIIVGSGTNTYVNLPVGVVGDCLTSNGTSALWGSCSGSAGTSSYLTGYDYSGGTSNLTGVLNGTNTTFTLSANPNPTSSLILWLNGQTLLQGAGQDYTLSGATVTMTTAPLSTDILQAQWLTAGSSALTNPMTTLGDIIYENSAPSPARLPGNTTTTQQYLSQVGNGSNSAAPNWTSILSATIQDTGVSGGQVFNVRAYGAVGNGTTDDTTAINAGWTAAKAVHGILYFPPGAYKYTSPLNFTSASSVELLGPRTPGAGSGTTGAVLDYEGSALSSTCPVEFTNSSYITVEGLSFASVNSVACQVLLGSAGAESFHIDFIDDWFQSHATVATVADFGAENVSFLGNHTDIVYGANGNAGVLISSNGGSGYGISSNFSYTFSAWSTTGYYFGPNIVFDGYGSAHALELDGTGNGIAFVRGSGTFFQVNQTGTGATAIYTKGTVEDVSFSSPRCESDAGANPSYFIQTASSALLENWYIDSLNQSSGCGTALYAPASSTLSGARITGDVPSISWTGNITGLNLKSYSSLNVAITGNLVQSTLDSFTGHGSDAVSASGVLNANINGAKNVVWYVDLVSGSSTYTLPSTGFSSGLFKATYNSAGCEFMYSEGFGAGAGAFATVSAVTSAVGYSGAQTLTCPTAGSTSSAPTIVGTYTNTGGLFIVQEY
ncbi:MAG: hypothetical protein KGN01_06240 [Patescibacteria group bacterium]|nr:hypothetical protein [Patescibacteria group bacterium]